MTTKKTLKTNISIVLFIVTTLMVLYLPHTQAATPSTIDTQDLTGTNGFTIIGAADPGELGRSVSNAGDVNGDGIDDVIVGDPGANRRCNNCRANGAAYVIFGTNNGFPATIDVSSLDGINGFAIAGGNQQLGEAVSYAGDINADGISDVVVGEPFWSLFDRSVGRAYVIFGRNTAAKGHFPANLDVSSLDGHNGFSMDGLTKGDILGLSVDTAGDINGDNIDDLMVGSPQNFSGPPAPGRAYVIYGRSKPFSANISLSHLDGNDGFVIVGSNVEEPVGNAISAAGDINADGIDDIIVSKKPSNLDGTESTEFRSHVVFGRNIRSSGNFPAMFFLSDLDGQNGFSIGSANSIPDQVSAMAVSGQVDINGDGIDDLILGEEQTDPDGIRFAGQIYVVFGRNTATGDGFPLKLEVVNLDGDNGFTLTGFEFLEGAGTSVSGAGDVNADGTDDLLIKTSGADRTYIVFGKDTATQGNFPARSSLSDLDGSNGITIINTSDTNTNRFSKRVSGAGDVNGDGVDDIIIGSPDAEMNGVDTGKSYVVFGGFKLLESSGGVVSARVDSRDNLIIKGDKNDNCIEIVQNDDSAFNVTGCEGTRIDAVNSSFKITNDIQINMKKGSDKVTIRANKPGVPDDLEIRMGKGADTVILKSVTVKDDIEIRMDKGDDIVIFENVRVKDNTRIYGGRGSDQIFVMSSPSASQDEKSWFTQGFEVETGNGRDYIDIRDAVFNDKVTVKTKGHNDGVCICGSSFNGQIAPSFDGGKGRNDNILAEDYFINGKLLGNHSFLNGEPLFEGLIVKRFERSFDGCSDIARHVVDILVEDCGRPSFPEK